MAAEHQVQTARKSRAENTPMNFVHPGDGDWALGERKKARNRVEQIDGKKRQRPIVMTVQAFDIEFHFVPGIRILGLKEKEARRNGCCCCYCSRWFEKDSG